MESLFAQYIQTHQVLGYIIFLFWLALEGQSALFTAAFFTREGILNINAVLLIATVGVVGTDYFLYYLGRYLHDHLALFHRWSDRLGIFLDAHIASHPNRAFAVAKFTFGLHVPVMMRAGSLKMPIRVFMKGDILSSFVWILIVFSLGYGSSVTTFFFRKYFHYAEIGLAVTLLLFVLGMYFLGKGLRKKI